MPDLARILGREAEIAARAEQLEKQKEVRYALRPTCRMNSRFRADWTKISLQWYPLQATLWIVVCLRFGPVPEPDRTHVIGVPVFPTPFPTELKADSVAAAAAASAPAADDAAVKKDAKGKDAKGPKAPAAAEPDAAEARHEGRLPDGEFEYKSLPLFGPGTNVLSTCHVSDLAEYILSVATHRPLGGGGYLLCADPTYPTQAKVAKALAEAFMLPAAEPQPVSKSL